MLEEIPLVQELPTKEWEKPTERFHLDPDKQDPVDPQADAEHRAILDQIKRATLEELKKVQESMAEAVTADQSLLKDRHYIEKLQAAYDRGEELLLGKTLH